MHDVIIATTSSDLTRYDIFQEKKKMNERDEFYNLVLVW